MAISLDNLTGFLQECIKKKDLVSARHVHRIIIENDLWHNSKLGSQLIRVFASCGSLREALQVFSSLHKQNVYTWTAIITAHVHHGQNEQALILYDQMHMSAVKANSYTFVAVLNACGSMESLDRGKPIHADIIQQGLEMQLFVGNTLIDMYAKCGSLRDASKVFWKLQVQDSVSWNTMIGGYIQHGHDEQALHSFKTMQLKGIEPSKITFTCILKACASLSDLDQGKLMHSSIMKRGLQSDIFIGNTLVDMYNKCGSLGDARKVFDTLSVRNIVSWSAMISGYSEFGHAEGALQLFQQMCQVGTEPNEVTFVCVLRACAGIGALDQGKLIHAEVIDQGINSDIFIGSILIDMYAKGNALDDARNVFDMLHARDVVSWSALIAGYAEHGHGEEALHLFEKMQLEGIEPNEVTLASILKACGSIAALDQGKLIHVRIMKARLESHLSLENAILDMYVKCSSLVDAEKIFDMLAVRDVFSWSTILAGYAEHDMGEEALQLFNKMKQSGVEPNEITFVGTLRACGNIEGLDQGKLIHSNITKRGLELVSLVGNTLVEMYIKCNSLEDARKVFEKLIKPDIVAWNAMILGCVQHGQCHEALELFEKMQQDGIQPDKITFVSLLKVCTGTADLDRGKLIHADIMNFQSDPLVGTTLLDMYAKCGDLENACRVFDSLVVRDVVCWNAMINGYASHGHWKKAQECFESMQQEGIRPVDGTFLSLLSVCSHSGLVSEGYTYFKAMNAYGIVATIEHHVCMIDLLGRAGYLHEAEDFILKMQFPPDSVIWVTLLASCVKYGNVEVGKRAFDCLVKIDKRNTSGYVLMSNIYAINHMWEDVLRIQTMLRDENLEFGNYLKRNG